ncbi:MAG: hypothetical protein QOD30_396 [Actinomycetota bacterium]|nr:hypothetical protein [Actinomycetota bacterium]
MKRTLALLALVTILAAAVAACGGDDDDSATAAGSTTSMTTDHMSSTTMASGDDMRLKENPCAPGGSGELPGTMVMTPTEGATPVTITATDYKFAGTDALKAGGAFAVTFENEGKELHELHVAKLADGEKRSVDEILADPSAESSTKAVGHSFACPGTTADTAGVDLRSPGRYLVLCFIPTGARADTDPKDFEMLGEPHAMRGMVVEIDIS